MTTQATIDAPALRVPRLPEGQRRLLVRLPNWLGDVVMAAPTLAAVRGARPQAEIVAVARAPLLSLARLLPGVDRAVPAGRDRSPGELAATRRALRALEADAAVVLPRSARAQLGPWLARVPVRLGYAGRGRRRLLTHAVAGWRPYRSAHRSAWFGLLARAFDAEPGAPWRLDPPEAARREARRVLGRRGHHGDRPYVVLEAGASYGPAKCWPAERFGALARGLLRDGLDVVTVGTLASRSVERVVERRAGPGLIRAAGRTPDLLTLAALLGEAALVVSNDTGPMHLAAATGTPVLALFGATDPVVSSPLGRGPRRLLYDPEPCSPCFLRTCPVPGHPCLGKVGVERVRREARALLDGAAAG